MKALLQTKAGVFLGVSSVLVAWALLAVRPVLAQVPSCPSPGQIEVGNHRILRTESTIPLDGMSTAQTPVNSFRITVPPLASGELTVAATVPTVGNLCRGSKSIATYQPDQPAHLMITEPVSTGDYFLAVRGAVANENIAYMVTVEFRGVLPRPREDGSIPDDTGSLTRNNQRDDYPITINDPGLLTVATRGRRDTKGVLYEEGTEQKIAEDEDSGSGGNFQIVTPIMGAPTDYVVYVDGQTGTERGDYTVVVDFKNVIRPAGNGDGCSTYPTIVCYREIEERGDADYFFITPTSNAFMTVETHKYPNTAPNETNTKGTLFGPNKQLAADSDTGDGTNFRITVPVEVDKHYVVKVEGESVRTLGEYRLEVSYEDVMGELVEVQSQQDIQDIEMTLTAPTGNEPVQVDRYVLNVTEAGTLQVSTTGTTDTFGTLIGPGGRQLAEDDDSGADENFQITRRVTEGLHGVTVQGAQRADAGQYRLVINFIENSNVTPPPTDPTPDPTLPADDHSDTSAQATRVGFSSSTPGELEIETDADYFQIAVTRTGTLTVETIGSTDTEGRLLRDGVPVADDDDSKDGKNFQIVHDVSPGTYYVRVTGYSGARGPYTLAVRFDTASEADLENPPTRASRSGIGVISGWVCEADTVEIEFIRGASTYRVPVAYGTSRDDTRSRCDDDGNNGFGLTWNWNLLAEGRWTVRALANGTEFDSASVDVVHLTDQEFAEGLVGECRVPNFPSTGQTTVLEWEESSQNFQIVDME